MHDVKNAKAYVIEKVPEHKNLRIKRNFDWNVSVKIRTSAIKVVIVKFFVKHK